METSRVHERKSFVKRLKALQRAKRETEQLLQGLEGKLKAVGSEKDDAIAAMEKMQNEQQSMREALLQEQNEIQERERQSHDVEKRMQAKISELRKALRDESERSRLVVGAEKELRLQRERNLEIQRKQNVDFNRLLRKTKENL